MAAATASYSSKGIGGIGHAILCLPANNSVQLFKTDLQECRHLSSLVTLRGYNTYNTAKNQHHQFRCPPDSRAETQYGQHSAS